MKTRLFNEFEEVSAKQWKQKIHFDLKGADYNETLVWKSGDGIDVKPFYHPEESPEPIPVRPPSHWNICEKIFVKSSDEANTVALKALEKGAESIYFILKSDEVDPSGLFEGIDLNTVSIYLELHFLSLEFISHLNKTMPENKKNIHLNLDIIGKLARTGNWFHNLDKDHEILYEVLSKAAGFGSVLGVNLGLYQNAGATIPQQLAYSLAHANEYLNHFVGNSQEVKMDSKLLFKVSVGSNYFFEIAKLRALRLLYSRLASEYGQDEECHILAEPSKRNKTLYDYNVNLLRTTTECMSAILGGADSISNLPYDSLYHKHNDFGVRIARNQLLILKNESYFEKAANPAEGSYYIEEITQQFAEKALEIFKSIEKGGGFLKQLKAGQIQKKISESAQAEQKLFDSGELVLVGTNKYPNPEDRMKKELEISPFLKKTPRKTLLQPILEKRLAEKYEKQRLGEEE